MWPLLILAALSMGFTIERLIFFKNAKLNPIKFTVGLEEIISGENISDVEVFCKNNNYLISKIVSKGLKVKKLGYEKVEKILSVAGGVEVSALEKGLNILSSIGTIAPMIGFLGTTSGMIMAFSDIAAADRVSAKIVAGGIEEALLTTAAGLLVAIPTLFSYNYFIHRIDLFATNIERISSDIIEKLIHEDYDEDKKKS
jgi:biopolymer transport protein ExbB